MAANGLSPIRSLLLATLVVIGSSQMDGLDAQQAESPQPPADAQSSPQPAPSPPQARQPEPAPKSTAGEGIPALVVDGEQMLGILGKPVRSSAGEDMGRIVDVIIDKTARVRGAVIDFGGFLGVGNRQIAVAWNAIRPPAQGKPGPLVVDFTRDQLRVAPAYKAGEQVVLLGPPDPSVQSIGSAPAEKSGNGSADKETPKVQPSK